jgi:Lon protease-like protein
MINFIPIFPLNVVVFPGEALNLHIFESQYKELIQDCLKDKKPFGIPVVLDKERGMEEYGILIEILELVKEYDSGEMDVRTRGISIFRVLETTKNVPGKLYSGAIVNYPENTMGPGETAIAQRILDEVHRLYSLMNLEEKFPAHKTSMLSYAIGHFVGLTIRQEYELFSIFTELQRLEYVRRHLNKLLPMIQELEQMKARIQLNGHFKNLSLGDF